MKKIISFILALTVCLASLSAFGYADYNNGAYISGELSSSDCNLSWYIDAQDGTLVINGEGVIPGINDADWNAFEFSKVKIGEGVTALGKEAFLSVGSLKEIDLPTSLNNIGERAFYNCGALDSVSFENVTQVGSMAFYGCELLKTVVLPKTLTDIGNYAFGYTCDEELDIELAEIGDFKIYGDCDCAAEKYAADNGIDFVAFSGVIKNDTTDLRWSFNKTESILTVEGTGEITADIAVAWDNLTFFKLIIGEGITVIGEEAFLGKAKLESVELSDTVEIIGDRSFYGCKNLKSIDFAKVTSVGTMAFFDCDALTCVTLPQTVAFVGNYAFGFYCDVDNDIEHAKRTDFTIRGKSGTAVSEYSQINEFDFEDLSPEQPDIIFIYTDKVGVTLFWSEVENTQYYTVYRKTDSGNFVRLADVTPADGTVYCDIAVKNGSTYTYSVVATVDGYTSSNDKNASVKFQKIDTPELTGTKMTREGITVSWNTVKSAKGYILYRKTRTTDWIQIADFNGNVKSYTDTTAKSGVEYYYTVKAYNGLLESGCDYDGVSGMYLSVPKLSKISNTADGINIQWKKVGGADGYIIGRKSGSSSWKQIAKVKDVASYTDKTAKVGTSYTYTVVPVSGSVKGFYNESGLTYKRLEKVNINSISNTNGGVKITWTPLSMGSGYIVYRKTTGGSYTKIATVSGVKSKEYIDKTAKSGTKYTYTVRVYSGSNYGAYDSTGKTVTYLSVPQPKSVSSAKNGVTFKWNKVSGADGYYVYRKTGDGGYKRIAQVKGNSNVSYLDKSAQKGKTYTYTVRAYKGSTLSSYNAKGLKIKDKY